MPKSRHHTTEEYEAAIIATGGFKSAVAKMFGVNRSAVTRQIQRSKKLQKILKETEAANLDFCESKLMGAIKGGDVRAIMFYLKTKGKGRGYIEQAPAGGDSVAPAPLIFVDANSVIMAGDNGGEPLKAKPLTMKEALKLSDGNSDGDQDSA